jgi:gliding motility-associated-like protein
LKDINNIDEILKAGLKEFNEPAPLDAWDAISKQIASSPTPQVDDQGLSANSGGQAGSGIWQSIQGLSLSIKVAVAVVGIGLGIGAFSFLNGSDKVENKALALENEMLQNDLTVASSPNVGGETEYSKEYKTEIKEAKKATILKDNSVDKEPIIEQKVKETEKDVLVQTDNKISLNNKLGEITNSNGVKDEFAGKINKGNQDQSADKGNLEDEKEKGIEENPKLLEGIQNEIEPEFGNAISPNGDGKNDVWEIKIGNTLYYRVSIFDRNGQMVFETDQPDKFWNGAHFKTGVDCESGTYSYVIEYQYVKNEKPKVKRGIINLFR